jgi:hypothetical protein
LQC